MVGGLYDQIDCVVELNVYVHKHSVDFVLWDYRNRKYLFAELPKNLLIRVAAA